MVEGEETPEKKSNEEEAQEKQASTNVEENKVSVQDSRLVVHL